MIRWCCARWRSPSGSGCRCSFTPGLAIRTSICCLPTRSTCARCCNPAGLPTSRFVLLHAGYPYTRELSYLASVYANVFMDLSLAIPYIAADIPNLVRSAFSLAPTSKVLFSTDAYSIPEIFWIAARWGAGASARCWMSGWPEGSSRPMRRTRSATRSCTAMPKPYMDPRAGVVEGVNQPGLTILPHAPQPTKFGSKDGGLRGAPNLHLTEVYSAPPPTLRFELDDEQVFRHSPDPAK